MCTSSIFVNLLLLILSLLISQFSRICSDIHWLEKGEIGVGMRSVWVVGGDTNTSNSQRVSEEGDVPVIAQL